MNSMKRTSKLFLILICLICLVSCKTVVKYEYIYPELPAFNVERPETVTLETIPQDSTYDETLKIMSINLIKLMDNNSQHILYEDTFLEFYEKVRQSLADQESAAGE